METSKLELIILSLIRKEAGKKPMFFHNQNHLILVSITTAIGKLNRYHFYLTSPFPLVKLRLKQPEESQE